MEMHEGHMFTIVITLTDLAVGPAVVRRDTARVFELYFGAPVFCIIGKVNGSQRDAARVSFLAMNYCLTCKDLQSSSRYMYPRPASRMSLVHHKNLCSNMDQYAGCTP